jgi:hypothetical protein
VLSPGDNLANEPPIFLFRHAVGFPRRLFETFAIAYNDLVSAAVDQLLLFETLQRLGNARLAFDHRRLPNAKLLI